MDTVIDLLGGRNYGAVAGLLKVKVDDLPGSWALLALAAIACRECQALKAILNHFILHEGEQLHPDAFDKLLCDAIDASPNPVDGSNEYLDVLLVRRYTESCPLRDRLEYNRLKNKRTVLHHAARQGMFKLFDFLHGIMDEDKFKRLLESGDRNKETVLHYAAKKGLGSTVEHLMAFHPGLGTIQDTSGSTAAHLAVQNVRAWQGPTEAIPTTISGIVEKSAHVLAIVDGEGGTLYTAAMSEKTRWEKDKQDDTGLEATRMVVEEGRVQYKRLTDYLINQIIRSNLTMEKRRVALRGLGERLRAS
jgi:hypothetical protein